MLKQQLNQKLLQKLSPQQIQLMKLLQVPTVELEQRIKEELEANPALDEGREDENDDPYEDDNNETEESAEDDFDITDYLSDDDTPDYRYNSGGSGDTEEKSIPIGSGKTFHEVLRAQLGVQDFTEHEIQLAENIIGNLDDSGYLRREVPAMVNDLAFTQNIITTAEELESVLQIIQEFDPPGVAARNLRECLLIQLNRLDNEDEVTDLAKLILTDYFDEFTKKHYEKIMRKLEIDNELLKSAIEEIIRLNPKPGNSLKETTRTIQHIVPDFLLNIDEEKLTVILNQRNAPELKVNRQYKEMMESYSHSSKKEAKTQKDALIFVKQKIDAAKWFIDAIKQRQQTLLITMNAIVEYQKEYFLSGDETKLKPMILKDIAEIVDMDISTISRVANSKYVQTPYGTNLLKYFFSESLSTDSGEEVSTREVKKILEDAVDAEEKRKPLTDEKLADLLRDKGYNIARRTVAKYREQLNIPVARLRKQL